MKLLLISLLMVTSLLSQSINLEEFSYNDRVYTKAELVKVSPVEVRVKHSDGVMRIPMINLPIELQTKLGASKEESDEYVAKSLDTQKKYDDLTNKLSKVYRVLGDISQVTPEGILIEGAHIFKFESVGYFNFDTSDISTISFREIGYMSIFIHGNTSLVDGDSVNCLVEVSGGYSFITVLGSQRTVKGVKPCDPDFVKYFNSFIVPRGKEIVNQMARRKLADGERKLVELKYEQSPKQRPKVQMRTPSRISNGL